MPPTASITAPADPAAIATVAIPCAPASSNSSGRRTLECAPAGRNSQTWQSRPAGIGSAHFARRRLSAPRKSLESAMFKGSMPALVTPFRDGAVDLDCLQALVEWHIEEGSHGLVPVGTTGESPTLSHDEHEQVIEAVVKAAAGRIPVIAGAGSNNTAGRHPPDPPRRAGRRRCRAGGDALLQQADPGRADRAFHGAARVLRTADHHLQHSRPIGGGHGAGHHGPAGGIATHHRGQGCHRRRRAGQPAASDLRRRFPPVFGRRRLCTRLQRPWRRGLHFRHGQCGAPALRRVSAVDA